MALPARANDAAIEGMQEYMMFTEYEAGIILPQQIDEGVFNAVLFIDVRDAEQFAEAPYPPARSILNGARCWTGSTRFRPTAR